MHIPNALQDEARALCRAIVFAAEIRKTAVANGDPNMSMRLGRIRSIKKTFREWDDLFLAEYPEEIAMIKDMVEQERRRANAAQTLKKRLGPPNYVFVKALLKVYREASGRAAWATNDRTLRRLVPNAFTDFVVDVFLAFCDGEDPPSLDTIKRAISPHSHATRPSPTPGVQQPPK